MNYLHKLAYPVLVLALLLTACARGGASPTPELAHLKVVHLPYLTFAPLFIAEEEGYFAEQALEVEFVKFDRSSKAIPALVQGDVDVLGGTISLGLFNAIARDANIKIVAGKGYVTTAGCPFNGLMARRELLESGQLDEPAHLAGRRVAANPSSSSGYYVEVLLAGSSLSLDDVEIVDIMSPVKLDALEKGTVDVVYASEPWVTHILRAGHGEMWLPIQAILPGFQTGILAYGPTLLEQNSDAGRRFMVAYLKAVQQYIIEGKTERNLEILAQHTGLDLELLKEACWPTFHDDGQIDVQSMVDFQNWAVAEGLIDSAVATKMFWDPEFIEYAVQVLEVDKQ